MKNGPEMVKNCILRANDFKEMILGASHFFERETEKINALNVFPVPDGDTGTNMNMTLKAAVKSSLSYQGQSIGELSEVVASGALMGARGNSGVILSQILRGIARGLRQKETVSPGELSKALQYGVVYAYKAVSKPVEGTILTVAREVARGIRSAVRKGKNMQESLEAAIMSGREALAKTTDMLPVLKDAGVVDAGGFGFLVFLEGWLYALKNSLGGPMDSQLISADLSNLATPPVTQPLLRSEEFDLAFPYCTEMIIINKSGSFDQLREAFTPLGDSLVLAVDKNLAKVHLHTANPGSALEKGLTFGSLHQIKIENMIDQQATGQIADFIDDTMILPAQGHHEKDGAAIIAVSFGEGFQEIFLSLGADEIVYGGQTMNPNVADLLAAVQGLPHREAIILPNNKNIIMVAEQVKALADKPVEVLRTKSLPEGLAALLAFNPVQSLSENISTMEEGIKRVNTGLLTAATRDSNVRGLMIKKGQYIGLTDDSIYSADSELLSATLALAERLIEADHDLATVYYGSDVNRQQAEELIAMLSEKYSDLDWELHYGGQPIYYYIISVE